MTLRKRIAVLLISFFCATGLIWLCFYLFIQQNLYQNSQTQLEAANAQISISLSENFTFMEQTALALAQEETAQDFLAAQTIAQRWAYAALLEEFFDSMAEASFIHAIFAVDAAENVYRFRGELSNITCRALASRAQPSALPAPVVLSSDAQQYVGFSITIFDENEQSLGTFFILTSEAYLQEIMYSSIFDAFTGVGIMLDDSVVVSSDTGILPLTTLDALQAAGIDFYAEQLGITPYYSISTPNEQLLYQSTLFFQVAAIFTFVLFLLVLWLFTRTLEKLFIAPMVQIMQNTAEIGTEIGTEIDTTQLSLTGEASFDALVGRINAMLARITENHQALFAMQQSLYQKETEAQKRMIRALKKQIDFHFIVNSLYHIKTLLESEKPHRASEMITGLCSMLQYVHSGNEYISGLDEMILLERYLKMMQSRYLNHFSVTFDITPEIDDVVLPRMLIQPLLENAITHGIAAMNDGQLHLCIAHVGDTLTVSVSDTGKGLRPEALQALQAEIAAARGGNWHSEELQRIALPNIQQRICNLFGAGYTLQVAPHTPSGLTVSFAIPFEREG